MVKVIGSSSPAMKIFEAIVEGLSCLAGISHTPPNTFR